MAGVDETKPFVPLKIAVLTVSDTRELADDKSGATLVGRIEAAGHALADRAIVPDNVDAIRARVKIGTSTVQSRATAGVAGATYIFCLPGSPGACRDAWDGILKDQLDYRHRPCNFVEIMPRLDEHLRRRAG
jgi:molybdenum cofactor biosynthesis protein B